ncbi:MAG: ribonuclease H-like domain-containing protein [Armatimonadota bacterium]|nr:ribonuclease H-like domain-containing protein [Armatimonadota bacterium]
MSKLEARHKKTALRLCEAQVRLYSYMVGSITGYMPTRAFIVTKDRIRNPLSVEVGMVLGQPLDPELAELRDHHLHIKAHGQDLLPWRDASVAPNFSNAGKNAPWSSAVKQIADLIPGGPLERLPGIGRKQTEALGHFGFDCLADALHPDAADFPFWTVRGIGERKSDCIQAILEANRTGRASYIPQSAVPERRQVEIFCDYETLSSISDSELDEQKPDAPGGEIVFMIGCGWATGGQWKYKQFTATAHTAVAERHLFDQFLAWLEQQGVFGPGRSATLYHWSGAELTFSRRAADRLGLPRLMELPWVDLLTVFKGVPIGIPKAFGFGLKEVGHAIGDLDARFAIEWPEGLNGLAALVAGAKMYKRSAPLKSPEFEILTRYLRTDVKSLWNVLRFLRDSSHRESTHRESTHSDSGPDARDAPRRGGWYALALGGA